jgi:hypothetical protein
MIIAGDTLVPCDGAVWLLFRRLSGPAMCATLPDLGDGVLRTVVDPSKSNAMGHQLMLAEACHEPITLDELVSLSLSSLN